MSSTAKLAAVVVAAAFLSQPLVGAAVCWQMATTKGACGGHCPKPEEQPGPLPVKAQPTVPACCAVSAPEPTPPASLNLAPRVNPAPQVLPLTNLAAAAEPVPAPVPLAFLARPAAAPSLSVLYCVFLI